MAKIFQQYGRTMNFGGCLTYHDGLFDLDGVIVPREIKGVVLDLSEANIIVSTQKRLPYNLITDIHHVLAVGSTLRIKYETASHIHNMMNMMVKAGFHDVIYEVDDQAIITGTKRTNKTHDRLRDGRQVAKNVDGIRADHVSRYEFACSQFVGGPILDVGCGVGYGSKILAERTGEKVLAIDSSHHAIDYANEHYQHDLVTYDVRDCSLSESMPENAFDLVVAFEIMEHVYDVEMFFNNISKTMRPDAVAIFSTPNSNITPYYPKRFNYHVRHYNQSEFESITSHFGLVVTDWHNQADAKSAKLSKSSLGRYMIATCVKTEN